MKWAFFPASDNGVGGAVVDRNDSNKPNAQGTLVYLNGGDDISVPLSRVEKAGGKILIPKTSIAPNGFKAVILDTEGNRVALHSMN